jgi:hypothetical protein
MSSSTNTQLRGVTDPKDRLRLLMEHGSVDEFVTELAAQVEQHVAVFWYEPGRRGCDLLAEPSNHNNEDVFSCLCLQLYSTEEYDLEESSFFRDQPLVTISVRWLMEYVGLEEFMPDRVDITAEDLPLANVLTQVWFKMVNTHFHTLWCNQVVDGMIKIRDCFVGISTDRPTRLLAGRFATLYYFRTGQDHLALTRGIYGGQQVTEVPETIIEDMIGYLGRIGMSEQEVQDELIHWLDKIALNRAYTMWPAVFNATCIAHREERDQIMCEKLLPEIWKGLSLANAAAWQWRVFRDMINSMLRIDREQMQEFFIEELTEMTSQGRVAFVYQFLVLFGEKLGMASLFESLRVAYKDGFHLAVKAERWGVAAALGQQFSEIKSLDVYPRALEMALRLSQPIVLESFELIRFED